MSSELSNKTQGCLPNEAKAILIKASQFEIDKVPKFKSKERIKKINDAVYEIKLKWPWHFK